LFEVLLRLLERVTAAYDNCGTAVKDSLVSGERLMLELVVPLDWKDRDKASGA